MPYIRMNDALIAQNFVFLIGIIFIGVYVCACASVCVSHTQLIQKAVYLF